MTEQTAGKNEEMGLPFGKMEKIIYAFDVDGTLISNVDTGTLSGGIMPNWRIVEMLKTTSTFKNTRIVVWSGGGKQYAEMWGNRLELDRYVWRYASKLEHLEIKTHGFVIAVDDIQDTAIGDKNLIVREK